MSKILRRAALTLAALAAVAVSGAVGATAAPPPASAAAETLCSQYSQGQVWQTSRQWVRARYRICLDVDPTVVRPKVQMQFDFPTNCTVSAGFPPSGGVSCPIGIVAKTPAVWFRNTSGTNGALVIPLQVHTPSGYDRSHQCSFPATSVSRLGPAAHIGTTTFTCRWPQPLKRRVGLYTVSSGGPRADVANDGDSWRILDPGAQRFTVR